MELNQFANACHATNEYTAEAVYRGALVAGLTGEAGEAAEEYKKMLRDDDGRWTAERRDRMAMELFDVLWYVVENVTALGFTLEEVANHGLYKLECRRRAGKIHGSGSDR